jgi:hypothetical protein
MSAKGVCTPGVVCHIDVRLASMRPTGKTRFPGSRILRGTKHDLRWRTALHADLLWAWRMGMRCATITALLGMVDIGGHSESGEWVVDVGVH